MFVGFGSQRYSAVNVFRSVAVLFVMVLLTGCGGGNDADGTVVESVPAVPPRTVSADSASAEPVSTYAPTDSAPNDTASPESVVVDPEAMRVLEAMFAAYAAAPAYADQAVVRVSGILPNGDPLSMEIPQVTVFTRPNRVRLQVYTATVVADGTDLVAFIDDFPGQVLRRAAPERLTVGDFFADPILAESLTQGAIFRGEFGFTQSVAWLPIPLLMLLDYDPARTLLDEALSVELLPPVVLREGNAMAEEPSSETDETGDTANGKNFCRQVRIVRRDGAIILRMDARSSLLREMEFPTGDYGSVRNMRIVAEFRDAAFAQPDVTTIFAWEIPDGIDVNEHFLPPREPAADVIGRSVPEFAFPAVAVENSPETGKPSGAVNRETCADRPLVVVFWATDAADSLDLLDLLTDAAPRYRDRLRILAVNVDPPTVSQAAIDVKWRMSDGDAGDGKSAENSVAGTLISVRDTDPELPVAQKFGLRTIPTAFFIGADGKIQDMLIGLSITEPSADGGGVEPDRVEIESRLEMLVAGNELGERRLAEIDARRNDLMRSFGDLEKRYAVWLEQWLADGRYRFTDAFMDAGDTTAPDSLTGL